MSEILITQGISICVCALLKLSNYYVSRFFNKISRRQSQCMFSIMGCFVWGNYGIFSQNSFILHMKNK